MIGEFTDLIQSLNDIQISPYDHQDCYETISDVFEMYNLQPNGLVFNGDKRFGRRIPTKADEKRAAQSAFQNYSLTLNSPQNV